MNSGSNQKVHGYKNEEKSFVGQRLIRTLKKNVYKYMTVISKNKYVDK